MLKNCAAFVAIAVALTLAAAPRKKIGFYFDQQQDQCFATTTKIAFETLSDCYNEQPHGKLSCAANSEPAKRASGDSTCFPGDDFRAKELGACPPGSRCVFGSRVGLCCDAQIEDAYRKETDAPCAGGVTAQIVPGYWTETPLLGKSCDDGFCPTGTQCQAGQYVAWCC